MNAYPKYFKNIILYMDELNHTVNDLDSEINDIIINYTILKKTLNKNDKIIEKLSHLADIKEIVWILNERILSMNDKAESENLDISKDALDRIQNNQIVKKVLQPYLPYILVNLCSYNT